MTNFNNKKVRGKIIWVNFLHMYQPPWQERGVIEQVSAESYEYLVFLFTKYPNWRASLNICGSLVEQLAELRPDILAKLKKLVSKGQIELVGTAKYHPILPLISPSEAKRQIELNQAVLSQYFNLKKIKGFYLPEMAYSLATAKLVKKLGYQWLILDSIHYKDKIDNSLLYKIKGLGLKVVFRDRKISKLYPPRYIHEQLAKQKDNIIITATDAEIYGHFHTDWRGFIEKVLVNKNLESTTVSKYLQTLDKNKSIDLRPASWESSSRELNKKVPYGLWNDPKNKIHKSLWQLVDLATKLIKKYKGDKNWHWARAHLDRGISSCTFWWATAKRPSPFSPLTWNPDMIDNGSEELIRSVRSLSKASTAEKIKAEKLYIQIKKDTWFKHWKKYHNK